MTRCAIKCHTHNIPAELVINLDQTGLNLLNTGSHTYSQKGAKQVILRFSEDKRQITSVLASTLSGQLLSEQLIFQGKLIFI